MSSLFFTFLVNILTHFVISMFFTSNQSNKTGLKYNVAAKLYYSLENLL